MRRACRKPQKHVHYAQPVEERELEQQNGKEENPKQRNSQSSGRTNFVKELTKNFRNRSQTPSIERGLDTEKMLCKKAKWLTLSILKVTLLKSKSEKI